jgi:hypothetical protein
MARMVGDLQVLVAFRVILDERIWLPERMNNGKSSTAVIPVQKRNIDTRVCTEQSRINDESKIIIL